VADPSETTQVSREPSEHETEALLGAVRTLSSQVGSLQDEVAALRHEGRGLPATDDDQPGWDEGQPVVRESPAWVRSVESPGLRRVAVPWLLVEIVFLVAVAVLAAVAGLDPAVIAVVMVIAWLLVAVGEWAMARSAARDHVLIYGGSTTKSSVPNDPIWFGTSGEDTVLDITRDDRTATRLPPPQPD
jgi:Flp pilus assembly protein TadB